VHDRVVDARAEDGQPLVVEQVRPDHGGDLLAAVREPHAHPVVAAAVEKPHDGPEPGLGAITEELVEPVHVGVLLERPLEAGGGRIVERAMLCHEAVEVAVADKDSGLVEKFPGLLGPPPLVEAGGLLVEGDSLGERRRVLDMDGHAHDRVVGNAALPPQPAGRLYHRVLAVRPEVRLDLVRVRRGRVGRVVLGVAGKPEDEAHQLDPRVDHDLDAAAGGRAAHRRDYGRRHEPRCFAVHRCSPATGPASP
jgi:hypothetical protein